MTFSPQIPHWGDANNQFSEKLYKYHSWLLETGIKNGLISNKDPQFVWDEFIIHSLYFGKIINELDQTFDSVYDLGTGGGIPGIPVAITNPKNQFRLVDISESRVFELQRLKNILNLEQCRNYAKRCKKCNFQQQPIHFQVLHFIKRRTRIH
jgi:16S rRNA (guanine527-N7)-methyltransferase